MAYFAVMMPRMGVNDRQPASYAPGGILTRIELAQPGLSPVSSRIATAILRIPDQVVQMSITELAERVEVSEGSISSFCKQLGLRGYQELKLALARDLVSPVAQIHEDLDPADPPMTVFSKVFASDIQALHDTLSIIDEQAVMRAAALIRSARRVEFYGIGSAAPVAIDAHYRLLRIGIPCVVNTDSHVQAVSASLTGPGVTTVTISHSGATMETLSATRLAKEAGADTIVITNFGKNPIQEYADVVLHTAARETRFRTEAMTSRIAELAIVDALTAVVALADFDSSLKNIDSTFTVLSAKRF